MKKKEKLGKLRLSKETLQKIEDASLLVEALGGTAAEDVPGSCCPTCSHHCTGAVA